jgi:WD40 repeat protein
MVLGLERKDQAVVWGDTSGFASILSVAYSADGTKIITGGEDDTVNVWNSADGKVVRQLEGPRDVILSVAFSPDGYKIIAGGEDGTILVWDSGSGGLTTRIEVNKSIRAVAFSPDGSRACLATRGGELYEWDLLTARERRAWSIGNQAIRAVVYSPDGSKLVSSGGPDEGAIVWDADSGELLQELQGDSTALYSIAFSPDNARLAIGAVSGVVTVWGCD